MRFPRSTGRTIGCWSILNFPPLQECTQPTLSWTVTLRLVNRPHEEWNPQLNSIQLNPQPHLTCQYLPTQLTSTPNPTLPHLDLTYQPPNSPTNYQARHPPWQRYPKTPPAPASFAPPRWNVYRRWDVGSRQTLGANDGARLVGWWLGGEVVKLIGTHVWWYILLIHLIKYT